MTVIYPYSLSAFADLLKIASVVWDVQRNDELSGIGDGRIWQAELAPPLWTGTVTLVPMLNQAAKQIAARIRKLHGAQEALFLYDPLSQYPQADIGGVTLGASAVKVSSVGGNFDTLALKGLPANYVLTVGDKMQIAYGANPMRYAFLEVSETVAANGAGVTASFGVFPFVPTGIVADLAVTLIKPACKCVIVPGSANPGTAGGSNGGGVTTGLTFKVIQKK
ncbi:MULTISPECIES: hypothetical protein [unclassified Rhizobium]|uniref:hypothetical protein n=1 Tax=unclassified Rhizobium TaxID=2613769 RepID=UPI00160EAF7E|nr:MULTISPECIES: hypothetical protein [unclassified Rhizobium]MBB3288154.1 hypothetical protein [Rhizobium sp. BK252]MBB3402982.1 hypothetical protein [Rhizobium sp. BK289]MBB3415559.1 hypothetical protein [Rhizobium sp. BK284]MBB3483360.1 hypothetical protein [Rhizobium sp. BK347]